MITPELDQASPAALAFCSGPDTPQPWRIKIVSFLEVPL